MTEESVALAAEVTDLPGRCVAWLGGGGGSEASAGVNLEVE